MVMKGNKIIICKRNNDNDENDNMKISCNEAEEIITKVLVRLKSIEKKKLKVSTSG